MTHGRFISFEGGEGVGKSTQARLLAEALDARGFEVVSTREPGGTPGAEAIRCLLLDQQKLDWDVHSEALLFAAARADHVARVIRPALQRGEWVICDRFLDSSRAYQGGEGSLTDPDVLDLHRIGSGQILPDLTILLEADPESAAERLAGRDKGESDRIGGRNAAFHEKVAARFSAIAEAEPDRFVRVAGDAAPQDVHAAIIESLEERFGELA